MRVLFLLTLIPTAILSHGYMSYPPPRGIEKETYEVDALKSPNTHGLCRGEPAGKVTRVASGSSLTLKFTITAPHTGPCKVTLLSYPSMREEKVIASKYDCAAPGRVGPWTITLPKASGRKILRWYWEGRHISTPGERYEQCADLDFGRSGSAPKAPKKDSKVKKYKLDDDKLEEKHRNYDEGSRNRDEVRNDYREDKKDYHEDKKDYREDKKDYREDKKDYREDKKDYREDKKGDYNEGGNQSCQPNGRQECNGRNFSICNHERWVPMQCGPGTHCKPYQGNAIICA